jgi:uncharacterized integral membrane protein
VTDDDTSEPASPSTATQAIGEPAQIPEPVPPGRTRAASLYLYAVVTAVLAIALIDFIAQNNRSVSLHFFGADGHTSEAVALLIAAVVGALLVAIPGSMRVVQLRARLRRANKRP